MQHISCLFHYFNHYPLLLIQSYCLCACADLSQLYGLATLLLILLYMVTMIQASHDQGFNIVQHWAESSASGTNLACCHRWVQREGAKKGWPKQSLDHQSTSYQNRKKKKLGSVAPSLTLKIQKRTNKQSRQCCLQVSMLINTEVLLLLQNAWHRSNTFSQGSLTLEFIGPVLLLYVVCVQCLLQLSSTSTLLDARQDACPPEGAVSPGFNAVRSVISHRQSPPTKRLHRGQWGHGVSTAHQVTSQPTLITGVSCHMGLDIKLCGSFFPF